MRFCSGRVEISGVDTAALPVITEEEKRELLRRSRAGDTAAREKMIVCNLRLVLSVIQRFANKGEDPNDLFQVGVIGLIKAIDNFDPAMNVRFATYGVALIAGELRRHLRDAASCALHVPRSTKDLAYHALRAREELQRTGAREPTVEEIASAVKATRADVATALDAIARPCSLSEPVYADGGEAICVLDQISDPESDADWVQELQFRDAVAALGAREKKILSMRYLGGHTQMQVADAIGISQAQVSRLEKSALSQIKASM